MYKIAVMGDYDSIYGFATLGLDTFPVTEPGEAGKLLKRLAEGQYSVIYVTEKLAGQIEREIAVYAERMLPAIILIPGRQGVLGIGRNNIQRAIERAVGADIL